MIGDYGLTGLYPCDRAGQSTRNLTNHDLVGSKCVVANVEDRVERGISFEIPTKAAACAELLFKSLEVAPSLGILALHLVDWNCLQPHPGWCVSRTDNSGVADHVCTSIPLSNG